MTLQAINRFPVKSCRGEARESAVVERWGLAGDRRWMVVDDDGVQLTAREHPRMILVRPSLRAGGGLALSAPELPDLRIDVPTGASVPVSVWKSSIVATPADDEAHQWFTKIIGRPARLVYLDDPTRRVPNQAFAAAGDLVSFADGYPLLLASTSSMDALNDYIAEGTHPDEGPLPIIRFRPNVVVRGAQPWEEDGWRRIRIGAAVFRAVKGCDRCVLTLVDPESATKGKEPIATLARHRRWDGATWFGMNMIPDTPAVTIRVGDEVEILESVPAPDGPPR